MDIWSADGQIGCLRRFFHKSGSPGNRQEKTELSAGRKQACSFNSGQDEGCEGLNYKDKSWRNLCKARETKIWRACWESKYSRMKIPFFFHLWRLCSDFSLSLLLLHLVSGRYCPHFLFIQFKSLLRFTPTILPFPNSKGYGMKPGWPHRQKLMVRSCPGFPSSLNHFATQPFKPSS